MVPRKRNITVMKVFFLIITFMLFLAGIINAGTIEVKQLGCGTQTDCYTTINSAIFYAQPDDTIKVYPGRYEEAVVINKNLTLIGSGPQVTTIYSPFDGITVNANMSATIIGFTITASNNGINIKRPTQTIIRNNAIISNGENGILIESRASTSSMINNVIAYNGKTGISSTGDAIYSGGPIFVHNNIINDNGNNGIYMRFTQYSLSYNDVIGNITGNYAYCSAGTGDISQTPNFIDPINGNFILQNMSLCKNSGRPGSADADPDGSRSDIGAYGGPDSAPFWPYPQGAPIITDLTVTPTSVQQGGTITINATGQVW